jgi:hypothetical protein
MKAVLSTALALGFCGLAGAADEKSDPVGTWKCEYEIGGQPRTSTLTIKKDGDKLAGTMDWPNQKEAKLKDLKLKDGELTFSAERVLGDNKYNVEYKLKVDGDNLKGKGAVETGGEKREFDFAGKREKKDK